MATESNHFWFSCDLDGIARKLGAYPGASQRPDPYMNSQASDPQPQGPGAGAVLDLSDRWQSRCLEGDPICGEGTANPGLIGQETAAIACIVDPNCPHHGYTKTNNGYNPTELGAEYLASKAFPSVSTSASNTSSSNPPPSEGTTPFPWYIMGGQTR